MAHPGLNRIGTFFFVIVGFLSGCGTSHSFSGNNPAPVPRQGQTSEATSTYVQTPAATPSAPTVDNRTPPLAPLPPGAIVQGSFTVFADPPHPMEGQDYLVHVRIRLPTSLSDYAKSDLSGTLVGTDGYTHTIGYDAHFENFMSGKGSAELIIFVPGAERGINDTLRVTSRTLNESQTIFIRFY